MTGALTNAGQVCYAPKRLYVPNAARHDFVKAVIDAAAHIVVGDGRDPAVTMGPVNNPAQHTLVEKLLRDAEQRRVEIVPLGQLSPSATAAGWFIQPHLVIEDDPHSPLMQAEQFGPLIPVYFYDDEDEAISLANDTEYGLAASVWSDDEDRAFRVAERLEAGTVFVNVHRVGASSVSMPFGGFKQSGLGRGHGIEGIHEHTELQVVAQREDMRSSR